MSLGLAGVALLRKTSLHNDAQKSRGLAGRKMSRRTQTGLPVGGESKCEMGISVRVDPRGFYLVGGLGCSLHTGHRHVGVKYTRLPSRFITAEEKELITDVAQAHAGFGAVRNLHYHLSGICLTTEQVAYISGMQEALEHNSGVSSANNMLQYFQTKGIGYCCLHHCLPSEDLSVPVILPGAPPVSQEVSLPLCNNLHVPTFLPTPVIALVSCPKVNLLIVTALMPLLMPSASNADILTFANNTRAALQTRDKSDLFMACAWIVPAERRRYLQFPKVLHIDSTADTNKEKQPLLTITGRNCHGKMITVLRAFLPNEQAWVFCWLFRTVMPIFLGQNFSRKPVS